MLTAADLAFWFGGLAEFAPVFEATENTLRGPVEHRARYTRTWLRAARTTRDTGDDIAARTFLFLAALIRASVQHLVDAVRVDLSKPIEGHRVVYVHDGDDGILRIYDRCGAEIHSLTLAQQGVIQLAAERARGIEPQRGPPPRAWGKDVRHSRNTVGTRAYSRGRA
jgi:hypothetical protein